MKIVKLINQIGVYIAIYKVAEYTIHNNAAGYIVVACALLLGQINLSIIEYIEKGE